jgi:hypothetical protein
MKRMRDDLALLEILRHQALILPGYGWRPPDDTWVKINTDAGVSVKDRKSGAGGIVRNPSGFVAA